MIIENPESFKSWLTTILEPLCDADPAALAKYVYALVKKEKPLDELRDGMVDQLDVFLQQETKPFVDMLFKSLETNEYLKNGVEKAPSPSPPQVQEETETTLELEAEPQENIGIVETNGPQDARADSPQGRVVVRNIVRPRPPIEQTLTKVLPLTELLEEPLDQDIKRRDRRGPDTLRDKDDRRRRPRGWDRRTRRRSQPRHENRTGRVQSRSPSPRGRYRNRSPPPPVVARPLSRSRSRSPVPRKRVHDRLERRRSLSRDRMSRDRDHRDRTLNNNNAHRSRSRSLTPIDSERERDRLSPVGPYKRRCRDFDVKGYCMRGELCVWDHGADPLVLEDAALHLPPEYNPMAPQIWSSFPFGGARPPPPALPLGLPPALQPALPPALPHIPPPPPRALVPLPRIRDAPPPHMMQPLPPRMLNANKKNFDYTRLGGGRGPQLTQNQANCSLEVKKVPRGMNDITHLNNHFGKFGKIINIQVNFEGDPEAALITFSNHTEANIAYKSTEAVLNNRFIKVFWHNAESKQENVPPRNEVSERPASQHPASNNKVLINRDNLKATADKPKEIPNGTPAPTHQLKKENPKPMDKTRQVMEMHKRAQTLLETQLQQQTLLIQKLEGGQVTGPQKVALMEAINSAQEGIEKLRKELVAYNKMMQQIKEETMARNLSRLQLQANAKRPKTREEAQKEILDAELDMFTKQQEGQDVTELAKKIAELRRIMSIQFPTHPPIRRPIHPRGGARFNSATRFVRNNLTTNSTPGPKVFVNQSVDHRPRVLLVSGFEADEVDGLVKHFAQFGEITGKEVNLAVPELTVQYKVRAQAEQAASRGRHYNERTLTITWVTNNKPVTPIAPPPASPETSNAKTQVQQQQQQPQPAATESNEELLRFDEEEDDEGDEERSWRR